MTKVKQDMILCDSRCIPPKTYGVKTLIMTKILAKVKMDPDHTFKALYMNSM